LQHSHVKHIDDLQDLLSTSLAHYAGYITKFAPNRLTQHRTQHNGQGFDHSIVQNIIHFRIDFVPCAHLRKFLPLEHSEE
jgi:hypothetical protein